MAPSISVQERPLDFVYNAIDSSVKPIAVSKPPIANQSLSSATIHALAETINNIDFESCDAGDEDSFFVADLGRVKYSLDLWRDQLPMVQPFYAVKCNPNMEVLKLLAENGCNFDCALKREIETVLNLGGVDVDPLRIIYANPCKTASYIRSAKELKVQLTTVDNATELYKLSRFYPEVGILIRIATDDETAQCRLLTKFGCTVSTATNELLPLAKQLGLNVRGVAFHVGLGATEFQLIFKAISDLKSIISMAQSIGFEHVNVLDIGGGFQHSSFVEAALMVRKLLNHFFAQEIDDNSLTIIGEPGRFMVANAFTLATNVIGRRDFKSDRNDLVPNPSMLYINDGVYGNMNCILFDHQAPEAQVLSSNGACVLFDKRHQLDDVSPKQYLIWGPTCDGLDCITAGVSLNYDVKIGDWLYFADLGAYTSAASTSFNGFTNEARVVYVNLEV